MTDLELELRDLAAHLDIPIAPSFAGAVRTRIVRRRRHRRMFVVALATAVVALAVALAVPSSRAALLRFFHVHGATVTIVDRLPRLTPRRSLGTPIPLNQASFRLLLPDGHPPDQLYAADGRYWLHYRGLLLFEFESSDGATILKKATLGATDVDYLQVRGEPGIWIGGLHAVYLPGGRPSAAGHVLIWQHGPFTLRLEANVGRDRALALAQSVR